MKYNQVKLFKSHKISAFNSGFSLVELIVSLGLFAVVSTIAIGSLFMLMDNNRQLRSDQSVISNIGFAFDMMSRDIRTGIDYYCVTFPPGNPSAGISPNADFNTVNNFSREQEDCTDGKGSIGDPNLRHGVSFVEPTSIIDGNLVRIAYYYDRYQETIMRSIGSSPPQSIISSQLRVVDADFIVTGESSGVQPSVTIFLQVESDDGQVYDLQTTVTQRLLDIQS